MKTFALASLLCAGTTANASLLEVRKRNRYLPPATPGGSPGVSGGAGTACTAAPPDPATPHRASAHPLTRPTSSACYPSPARIHAQFKDNDGSCTLEKVGGVLRSSCDLDITMSSSATTGSSLAATVADLKTENAQLKALLGKVLACPAGSNVNAGWTSLADRCSCPAGQHVDGSSCIRNTCFCAGDGSTPATGVDCPTHGADKCASCGDGTHLVNGQCETNQCPCENGTAVADGKECRTHGESRCTACDTGFSLNADGACASSWVHIRELLLERCATCAAPTA